MFIFAPMVFALHFLQLSYIKNGIIAFVLFGIVTGCVYIINDCIDKNNDRFHPLKRLRPIASGQLKVKTALVGVVFLLVVDLLSLIHI